MSKSRKTYDYPLYVVVWKDAVFDSDDSKADQVMKPEQVMSVGWLLKDAKDHIVLCQDYGDDQWVRRRLTIPADMVIQKKEIKFGARRKAGRRRARRRNKRRRR
jgi:hypothetical protein